MTVYIDVDTESDIAWKSTNLSSDGIKPVSISFALKLFYSKGSRLHLIVINYILN